MTEKPIGILGGTFDPVHRAHMQLAEEASARLGLERVVWIPSGKPPHRVPPHASAEHRLAMVALAIGGNPHYSLDDSEVNSAAPSYTVTTLQRLRAHAAAAPLVLLLGADAFLGLTGWHRWRELFELAHIAVATRPGHVLDPHRMDTGLREEYRSRHDQDIACLGVQSAGSIVSFNITPLDISATAIRALLASGKDVQELLPKTVLDYIVDNQLYLSQAAH